MAGGGAGLAAGAAAGLFAGLMSAGSAAADAADGNRVPALRGTFKDRIVLRSTAPLDFVVIWIIGFLPFWA